MKIGCPNNPRSNILKEIEWIGRNGFDFVDLFLEEDSASPSKINVQKVKALLEAHQLSAVGHLAWYLPFGSPVRRLREAAVEESAEYLEIFATLGVKYVTVHMNWPGGMFSDKEGISFQVESLGHLLQKARPLGISIMLEPVDGPEDTVQNVSKVLQSLSDLLFHLDIGHANLYRRTPVEFIREFHSRLAHVHLHDNSRNLDLHLPMGCGNIDWKETLKALKRVYDGTITLEIFSRDRDFMLLSRDKLLKLWQRL